MWPLSWECQRDEAIQEECMGGRYGGGGGGGGMWVSSNNLLWCIYSYIVFAVLSSFL